MNCINIFIIIWPPQIAAAVTFLFTIHKAAAIGVNMVNMITVNCLTINLIFNFTKRYMNIAITKAVVIALPVLMEVSILSPRLASNVPVLAAVTNRYTKLLLTYSKNLINKGAIAIATPPKHSLIKLSFASFFFAVFIPAFIILYDRINTAIKIRQPLIIANTLYQFIVLSQSSCVKGDKASLLCRLLNINSS